MNQLGANPEPSRTASSMSFICTRGFVHTDTAKGGSDYKKNNGKAKKNVC